MSALHVAHAASAGWFATTLSATATWFVMMALMMAPVAWPWAVAFSRFDARAPRSVRVTLTSIFVAGYAAAWLLYSLMAALMQTWIGHTLPASAVAAVLIGAGWALGESWTHVQQYQQLFGYGVLAALGLAVAWFVWRRLGSASGGRTEPGSSVKATGDRRPTP